MSVKLIAAVWEESPYEATALLLHLALADHANDEGVCWPSAGTLATKARCSREWATKLIAVMEREGWLVIQRTPGRPHLYRLTAPAPAAPPGPGKSRFPAPQPATENTNTPLSGGLGTDSSQALLTCEESSHPTSEESSHPTCEVEFTPGVNPSAIHTSHRSIIEPSKENARAREQAPRDDTPGPHDLEPHEVEAWQERWAELRAKYLGDGHRQASASRARRPARFGDDADQRPAPA